MKPSILQNHTIFTTSTLGDAERYRFGFNGKEFHTHINWIDYGARFYNPALGRWHNVDAMAETYHTQSPYHFSGNNPVFFIEQNGMSYGWGGVTPDAGGIGGGKGDEHAYLITNIEYSEKNDAFYITSINENYADKSVYGTKVKNGASKKDSPFSQEQIDAFNNLDPTDMQNYGMKNADGKGSQNSRIIKDYAEKTYDFAGNDLLGAIADISDDIKITKNVGIVLSVIDFTNHQYHYFGKKDITKSEYIYRNVKTSTLFTLGLCFSAEVTAPAAIGVYSYEKAYEYVDENVKKSETTLRSSSFWEKLYTGW